MPAYAYYEEGVFDADDLTDTQIAAETDVPTLEGWYEDLEASVEDIRGQLEAASLGGGADPDWVYRASKSMGFFRRAQSRVRSRLIALGIFPQDIRSKIAEANKRADAAKAENIVAREFHRLCREGALSQPEFDRLDREALNSVATRRADRKAAHANASEPQGAERSEAPGGPRC